MTANRLLRSISKRHILRPGPQIKVRRNFNLVRQHVQKELVQRRHYSCLRSFMSFISFQLFNVLKFMLNHLILTTFHQVRLPLQLWHMSNNFAKLCTETGVFSLNMSSLSLKDNQVTLAESVCHTFRAFERFRTHTAGKGLRNTLLTRSHDFNSLSEISDQAVMTNSWGERLLNTIVRHSEEVWGQIPQRGGVVLSTSLTGLCIHENRVYLVLLKVLECEQQEHCLRCLSASRVEHEKLMFYIVVIKSSMNLTCWIYDSNLIHC